MKKITVLASLFLLLIPACVTTPEGKIKPDAVRVGRIAGRAAYFGTVFYLTQHADQRPIFAAAAAALKTLEDTQNWDYAAFAAALHELPIRQLQGDQGMIIVQLTVEVWDEVLQLATPLLKAELLAAAIPKIRDGIERALATRSVPPPRAADYPVLRTPSH